MNVVRKWKRAVFVGCSHGLHIDEQARRAVLKFIDDYKPADRVHLGDFTDTAALRAGAKGSSDEGEPVDPDITSGLEFLAAMRATHVLEGNHDVRPRRFLTHHNAVVAYAAKTICDAIDYKVRQLRAVWAPYKGIWQGIPFGPFRAMHGVFYSENATRDHAEAFGPTIHAHTHRPAVSFGRRSDNPVAFCVGTLTRVRELDYANTRRATMSWGQGLVFGEYCDDAASFQLCLGPTESNQTAWRLP